MGELRGCVQCRGLSDTLLVVSILVYDCHLWVVVQSWGVNNSSCGNYGFFLACGGRGLLGCARGRGLGARALPSGFILLGGFGDTLLVVSILDMVYDCHLQGTMVSFWAISRLWGSLWAVSKVESSARAHLAFRGLSCWEASVTLYLWFRFWT